MLEERFNQISAKIGSLSAEIIANTQGLADSVEVLEALGQRPIRPLGPDNRFDLRRFNLDSLSWEERLESLEEIAKERRRLRTEAIPGFRKEGPLLEVQMEQVQKEKDEILDEISALLVAKRKFVVDNVRSGDLLRGDIGLVDEVYERYGLPLPEGRPIPTPRLDAFFKLVKNPQPYSVFINSHNSEYLIRCLNSNMRTNNGILDSDIGGAVSGYSFEQMVAPQLRPLLMGIAKESGVQTFFILPPKDTFDLIKAANPKKLISEYSSGLRRVIEGTRVPDALIFVPKGRQLYLSGVCEITAANLECESNERKQGQIDYYEARHDGVYEQMAKIFEEYNRNITTGDVGAVLERYEVLAGKKINVFNPDEGFKTWYLIPYDGRLINGIPKDRFLKVNVGFTDLRNFVDALLEDYSTEYSLLGEVVPTALSRSAE